MKILFDIGIIVVIIGGFLFLKITGIVPIIIAMTIAVIIHNLFEGIFDKKIEEKIMSEVDKEPKFEESLLQVCRNMSEDFGRNFLDEVDEFTNTVSDFNKRKDALWAILELTGENAEYIKNASDEAEKYLYSLAKRLRIKLTALSALDEYDMQFDETIEQINLINEKSKELVDEYSNLLTEASKANDDETDNSKLTRAIDKLKNVREESRMDLGDLSSEGLFVTSSGNNLGI